MAAELGDEVMMFDSHYVIKFGKIRSRNQDGSVVIEDHDGMMWVAEVIAAYQIRQRSIPPSLGEEISDGIQSQESNGSQSSAPTSTTRPNESNCPAEGEGTLQEKPRRKPNRKQHPPYST
jgi:hypothetical protein